MMSHHDVITIVPLNTRVGMLKTTNSDGAILDTIGGALGTF